MPARRDMLRQFAFLGAGAFACAAAPVHAARLLRLDVQGVGSTRVPVALAPFEGPLPEGAEALHEVIASDMQRSGMLQVAAGDAAPDASLHGSVQSLADGRWDIRWKLKDRVRETVLAERSAAVAPGDWRLAAHRIADEVQELLTGVRGVAATRIAFVAEAAGRHLLQVADADGAQVRTALASAHGLISPAWSPDGRWLAYTSFESGQAQVWLQELASGRRRLLAAFRGSNSAPAWSPDGRRLALALSRDGLTQVFLMPVEGGTPERLTRSSGIDTEPAWAPDGRSLFFTSDRGGAPQIYRQDLASGSTQRVSFGNYCVSPAASPDGRWLAYVSRLDGALRVVVKDLESGAQRVLSDSDGDERPSFAPNGRLLAYATRSAGREVLMAAPLDGGARLRLLDHPHDAREPSWGPWVPGQAPPPVAMVSL
jgi:TolB protein